MDENLKKLIDKMDLDDSYYHYLDNDKSNTRPMILSRYSGPGSHRYPLGFSDQMQVWIFS